MKKNLLVLAFVGLLSVTNSKTIPAAKHPDYVPDGQTAIKIAEAIWLPILGKSIYDERPFNAHLTDNVWHVSGTKPDSAFGGVPMIDIRKSDCKILGVWFPK